MKKIFVPKKLYITNGLIAIAFGMLLLAQPFGSALAITIFIGVYIVLLGIFSLIISFRMKNMQQQIEETTTETFRLH